MSSDALRLDTALVKRGLAPTRERAQGLIQAGLVYVNGAPARKNAFGVAIGDDIQVLGDDLPYVSRGALKLKRALEVFAIDPTGCVAMDIGASTGGFTEVLLENGARRVYAVDVGTNQLHEKLRRDARVIVMEQTNARLLTRDSFPEQVQLGVMDVSFISVLLVLPALFRILEPEGRMVALIKPQFEAGRSALNHKGIVTDRAKHMEVLARVCAFMHEQGWRVEGIAPSPIEGSAVYREYLMSMAMGSAVNPPEKAELRQCVYEDKGFQFHSKHSIEM